MLNGHPLTTEGIETINSIDPMEPDFDALTDMVWRKDEPLPPPLPPPKPGTRAISTTTELYDRKKESGYLIAAIRKRTGKKR